MSAVRTRVVTFALITFSSGLGAVPLAAQDTEQVRDTVKRLDGALEKVEAHLKLLQAKTTDSGSAAAAAAATAGLEAAEMRRRVADLEERLGGMRLEVEQLRAAKATADTRAGSAEQAARRLQTELEQTQAAASRAPELERQNRMLATELEAARRGREQSGAELGAVRQELTVLRATNNEQTQRIRDLIDELQRSREAGRRGEAAMAELDRQLAAARSEHAVATAARAEAEAAAAQRAAAERQRSEALAREAHELRAAVEDRELALAELRRTLARQEEAGAATAEHAQRRLDELEGALARIEAEAAEQTAALAAARARVAELEAAPNPGAAAATAGGAIHIEHHGDGDITVNMQGGPGGAQPARVQLDDVTPPPAPRLPQAKRAARRTGDPDRRLDH